MTTSGTRAAALPRRLRRLRQETGSARRHVRARRRRGGDRLTLRRAYFCGPPRGCRFAHTSTSWPSRRSSRAITATNTPRAGSRGPANIWVTSRTSHRAPALPEARSTAAHRARASGRRGGRTCSSSSRVTGPGSSTPPRLRAAGANRSRRHRQQVAAQPCGHRDGEAALGPRAIWRAAASPPPNAAAASSPGLGSWRTSAGQRELCHEPGPGTARGSRRMRHAHAVGLGEQVVREVRGEVYVLQPRQRLRPAVSA